MAHFDFSRLHEDIEKKIGYKLYSEYGEIADDDLPRRNGNGIDTPIVGIFRLNPVPLTALSTPYIAVASGTIEIPAPVEKADEVCKKLDETASLYNATTKKGTSNGTMFTVVYSFETCAVGEKRRDVSLYSGEVVIITQTVTFTIIEQGITAYDTELFIDGLPVPFLRFEETRTAASEVTPNDLGNGEIAVTQEMYGITFDTPLVQNDLGDLLMDAIADGCTNKAHVVEVARGGKRHFYLMAFGTIATTAIPPSNVGVSASLAEVSPIAAKFSSLFGTIATSSTIFKTIAVNNVFFWGDGTAEYIERPVIHVFSDSGTHTVRYFSYGRPRFGEFSYQNNIFKKTVRLKDGVWVEDLPVGNLISSFDHEGDKIYKKEDGSVAMSVGGEEIRLDRDGTAIDPFICMLRGIVYENADIAGSFEYDYWAVTQEV